MADERKCYAGDLSSDALGKTVRVTYTRGNVTSTVEDVLKEVRHTAEFLVYSAAAEATDRSLRRTVLFFRGTQWTSRGLFSLGDDAGLTVDDTLEVVVLP